MAKGGARSPKKKSQQPSAGGQIRARTSMLDGAASDTLQVEVEADIPKMYSLITDKFKSKQSSSVNTIAKALPSLLSGQGLETLQKLKEHVDASTPKRDRPTFGTNLLEALDKHMSSQVSSDDILDSDDEPIFDPSCKRMKLFLETKRRFDLLGDDEPIFLFSWLAEDSAGK